MMKTAIIGSGVAALEAAIQIKALKPESEVVMYSREKVRPYRRPALSGMIAEPMNEAQFYIKPETFYQDKGIRLELDHTVTAIQPSEKFLTFADGHGRRFRQAADRDRQPLLSAAGAGDRRGKCAVAAGVRRFRADRKTP